MITRIPHSLIPCVLCLLTLSLLTGCPRDYGPTRLRQIKMNIGERSFTLEVADTAETRRIGLMNRDSMPMNHGMIFVFEDEEHRSFWMKNTRFPLDIIFVDASGKVVSIHQMKAYDEFTHTRSRGPAKYAIELNLGVATTTGIKPGDQLTIPAEARSPKPSL